MQIGQIEIPAVNVFEIGEHYKNNQHIGPMGMQGFVPAEFQPELSTVEVEGYLLQPFNSTRTLYQ